MVLNLCSLLLSSLTLSSVIFIDLPPPSLFQNESLAGYAPLISAYVRVIMTRVSFIVKVIGKCP